MDLPTGRRRERIRHAAPAVLLVQTETGIQAVTVQSVLDSRDLVIKSPGRYVPRIPGIAGATILGSGEVSAVLDLPELLRLPARRIDSGAPREAPVDEADLRFKALVVDDSLSARRALLRVLEDAGYAVRGARDGLEAVELMAGFQPDVVLVDMEMPRMNGLELTTHLRGHPQTARLPIVMITSRSTAKHRQQADAAGVDVYFTKPFSEDTLLDAVTDLLTGLPSRRVEA